MSLPDLLHLKSIAYSENSLKLLKYEKIQIEYCSDTTLTLVFCLVPKKVIFSYTSLFPGDKEEKVLVMGLDFTFPPRKLNYCSFLIRFEMLCCKIPNRHISSNYCLSKDSIRAKVKLISPRCRYETG